MIRESRKKKMERELGRIRRGSDTPIRDTDQRIYTRDYCSIRLGQNGIEIERKKKSIRFGRTGRHKQDINSHYINNTKGEKERRSRRRD